MRGQWPLSFLHQEFNVGSLGGESTVSTLHLQIHIHKIISSAAHWIFFYCPEKANKNQTACIIKCLCKYFNFEVFFTIGSLI